MRFYNREEELKELKRIQQLAFEESSRMTVVTGRRRIGKTSLIMKAVEQTPTVYLFIGRKNEATLCEEFIPLIAQALQIFVPTEIRSFRNLFQYLMQLSTWLLMNFRNSILLMNPYSAICKIFGTNIGSPHTWIWLSVVPSILLCKKFSKTTKSRSSEELIT